MDENFDVNFGDLADQNEDLKKQILMIKTYIYDFDMDLQGYEWDGSNNKYKFTGDCLVDSEVRSKIISSLKPFTSPINLIGEVEQDVFSTMKWRTNSLINETLTSNRLGVPIQNKRLVMNKYMNTLKLIGGVILGSKSDMFKLMLGNHDERETDMRIN